MAAPNVSHRSHRSHRFFNINREYESNVKIRAGHEGRRQRTDADELAAAVPAGAGGAGTAAQREGAAAEDCRLHLRKACHRCLNDGIFRNLA